jgi:hypothetical protein
VGTREIGAFWASPRAERLEQDLAKGGFSETSLDALSDLLRPYVAREPAAPVRRGGMPPIDRSVSEVPEQLAPERVEPRARPRADERDPATGVQESAQLPQYECVPGYLATCLA